MTLVTLSLNGSALESDLGLVLVSDTGLRSIAQRTYPTVVLARIQGERIISSRARTAVRTITLRNLVRPTSFTDRTTKLDALAAYANKTVSLILVDAPARAISGRLVQQDVPLVAPGKPWVHPEVYLDWQLICHDPYYYDTTPVSTSIAAGGAAASLSMGTADAMRRIVITATSPSPGPATNPVIILKDQSANEVARMTLTGVLYHTSTATALQPVSIAIDCDAWTLTGTLKNGTTFDAVSWLGATETPFELHLTDTVTGYTLQCAQAALAVSHYRAYAC